MLPFTDIDFFLFALFYVAWFWLFKLFAKDKAYPVLTCIISLFYFVFYFRYSVALLTFVLGSYVFTSFVAKYINHKLWSSIVLLLPMLVFKLHVELPFLYFAGLSFVSFRSVQVLLDHDYKVKIDLVDYFNFLCFIPSFYIGPLDRFKRFSENTKNGFTCMNFENTEKGIQQFAIGVLYKFVIAEFVSRYWLNADIFSENKPMFFVNDMYAYALYLFFDFAGYSSMAIGMGLLVGISLPANFNAPFIALNPTDFWQRWHASLTSWLTDYLFKPFYKWLNGFQKMKKAPLIRQNIAIFATLCTMGFWNGFELNFIVSGLLYGLSSVIHNTYQHKCRVAERDVVFGNLQPIVVKYISLFIMFNFTCFALYIFSGRLIH